MSDTKNPIKLICYTSNPAVYRYARIANTGEYKPDWWKNIPAVAEKSGLLNKVNMKLCNGFNDLFKKGFVIPMWSDCVVRIGVEGDVDYDWQYSDQMSEAEIHPQEQRGEYLPETKYSHIKFQTPWLIFCEEDVDFLLAPISWLSDHPEDFVIPTGILEFKYNHEANTNVMFRRRAEEQMIKIEYGVPLTQFIPLSDRPVELDVRLVDSIKFDLMKAESARLSETGWHYKKVKSKHDSGCPFAK
jgi:hypothetical protein